LRQLYELAMAAIPTLSQKICTQGQLVHSLASDYFFNHALPKRQEGTSPPTREPDFLFLPDGPAGEDAQRKLIKALQDFQGLAGSAKLPDEMWPKMAACHAVCGNHSSYMGAPDVHLAKFTSYLQPVVSAAEQLADETPGLTLFIADTNTLVRSPALEKWAFDDVKRFTIILPSTTIGEIDGFANSNKSEEFKAGCKRFVRQIKGYRDRAREAGQSILVEGAVIVRDKIMLRIEPREPVFPAGLNWLDKESNDDRLVARTISVARDHPQCSVALVTHDVNLQTKAELAGVNYIEPSEAES
jgi:hypothetical protein